MFAVALNYLLSLLLVLVVFALAWGAARLGPSRDRSLRDDTSGPFIFLAAAAFLLVAGIGKVGMTHPWSTDSVATTLDQGVFLVLMAIGAFLLVFGYLRGRHAR
jgi:hypothetical protein